MTVASKIKDLPTPKGKFILGHLPEFKSNSKHLVLEKWIEECGELFKINLVGKVFVVSANPKFNNQVLKLRPEKFRRFSKINEIFLEMGINGVFNAEGDNWKKQRIPAAEALNVQRVKEYFPVIVDKTQKLLEKFDTYSEQNSTVDVQKEFMRFTIDITTEIAFGYKMDTINQKDDEFQKHLEIIFPMINQRITAPIPTWRFIKNSDDKKLLIALKEIESIIYRFINEAKERIELNPKLKERPSNFLEALLVDNNDVQFNDEEIYGNVFTMLLAGEDTTSNSISWIIYYLAQNSEIVKKIRNEAIEVFDNSLTPNSPEDYARLKYTNAVVQEAIRLKPTTPQLYVESIEDVTIEGLEIPKNSNLILANKYPQNQDKYFSNASDFIPERWMTGGCPMHENHDSSTMKAFGGGARYCPGMHLAMNEMVVLVSSLCKKFDFKLLVKATDVSEEFAFTMHPGGLLVGFSSI